MEDCTRCCEWRCTEQWLPSGCAPDVLRAELAEGCLGRRLVLSKNGANPLPHARDLLHRLIEEDRTVETRTTSRAPLYLQDHFG